MPTLFDADLLALLRASHEQPDSAASRAGQALLRADRAERKRTAGADRVADVAAAAEGLERGYFTFIRIDVRHDFFNRTGGVCDEVAIRPTAESRRRLALYGLVPHLRSDGIDILWTHELQDGAVQQLKPVVKQLARMSAAKRAEMAELIGRQLFGQPLFFTVSVANPLFANFTEMPDDHLIGGPPLLLSTRAATPRKGEDHHADLNVNWRRKAVRPPPAKAPRAWAPPRQVKPVRSSDSQIGAAAGPGFEERQLIRTNSRQFALFDLYLVRGPGSVPVAGQWDGMPISLDPGSDEGESRGGGIFHRSTYTLHFEARRTRWRYIVARRDGTAPDKAGLTVVEPGGGDAGFELEDERILPDGRTAICLSSKGPLPLLARPQQTLSLMGMPVAGRARRSMLVDRLPVAGTASISPAASPDGTAAVAWSDIYVFI